MRRNASALARALVPLVLAGALAGAAVSACELLTHAGDYKTAEAFAGFCNACPASGLDLRRPPCPVDSDDPDTGETFFFAARELYFTVPQDLLTDPALELGFDMDCSDRPDGRPVRCQPQKLDAGTEVPWTPLPHGIDNTLLSRIFGPLLEQAGMFGQEIDINGDYTKNQVEGRIGIVVSIDEWNGTPNDPSVLVDVSSSAGVSEGNGKPRWDGTDSWDLYSDVPGNESKYFKVSAARGYVSGGILVVDYRSRGDVNLRFGSPELSFRMFVNQVVFVGQLSPEGIKKMTMVSVGDMVSTFETIPELASVLSACNPVAKAYLDTALPKLILGAADMPTDPESPPDKPCDGVSMGWAFDAYPARLGGYKAEPDPTVDGGACF